MTGWVERRRVSVNRNPSFRMVNDGFRLLRQAQHKSFRCASFRSTHPTALGVYDIKISKARGEHLITIEQSNQSHADEAYKNRQA